MSRRIEMIAHVRKLAHKIIGLARARRLQPQVFIRIKRGILARFTNNGVHQNGFQDLLVYSLHLPLEDGTIWVESNDDSEKGIRRALRRLVGSILPQAAEFRKHGETAPASYESQRGFTAAKATASSRGLDAVRSPVGNVLMPSRWEGIRTSGEPKARPLTGPAGGRNEYFHFDLKRTPEMAATAIGEALNLIRREQASANGYFSAYHRFFYFSDSRGQELIHPATAVRFGVTITKGEGRGYSSAFHPNPEKLNVNSVVTEAMNLTVKASRQEVSVPPGTYECIFSPRAFLEFVEPLRHHFDKALYETGKSVFSGRRGKRLFSEAFTLSDDLTHPKQFGVPFDMNGDPKPKVIFIERGVVKNFLAAGHATRGILEHPYYPQNLVIEGGTLSLKEIFTKIRKGVFINKVRYHTVVRESTMEVTGLVSAGGLYLEKGQVVGRASHLRYHDSLFSILGSVRGASKETLLLKDREMGAALFPYLWISRLHVV